MRGRSRRGGSSDPPFTCDCAGAALTASTIAAVIVSARIHRYRMRPAICRRPDPFAARCRRETVSVVTLKPREGNVERSHEHVHQSRDVGCHRVALGNAPLVFRRGSSSTVRSDSRLGLHNVAAQPGTLRQELSAGLDDAGRGQARAKSSRGARRGSRIEEEGRVLMRGQSHATAI